MFLANQEKVILDFLNEYGQATKEQLKALFNASDRNIQNLVRNRLALEKDGLVMLRTVEKDERLLYCIDFLILFMQKMKDIQWHVHSGFPFYITFYRNNKVYDITAVYPGEEVFMETALSRSQAERIIVVAPYTIRALNVDKNIRYYNPTQKKFYKVENGEFCPDGHFSSVSVKFL